MTINEIATRMLSNTITDIDIERELRDIEQAKRQECRRRLWNLRRQMVMPVFNGPVERR